MPFAITRCSNKKLTFTLRTFVILQAIRMVYEHFVHNFYFGRLQNCTHGLYTWIARFQQWNTLDQCDIQ